jgi:hypothetical protein
MCAREREKKAYDLDELLAGVKLANLHGETDLGGPVGRENFSMTDDIIQTDASEAGRSLSAVER